MNTNTVKRRGSRPKSFNVEEKVNSLVYVFWDKGFWGTTLDDLLEYTGIAKQSLYHTYGDKRDMYIKALKRYAETWLTNFDETTNKEKHSFKKLKAYVYKIKDLANDKRGCLMCSASLETASRDAEIAKIVEEYFKALEAKLIRLIKEGQKAGELPNDSKAQVMADMVMSATHSICVYSRLPNMEKQINNVAKGVIARFEINTS